MKKSNEQSVKKETYKASEVAKILDISERAVYDMCEKTEDFKIIRFGKRGIRIHKASFDEWLNS